MPVCLCDCGFGLVAAFSVVTTFAGGLNRTVPPTGTFADGNGTNAGFNMPTSVAVDRHGNVFVADYFKSLVRKVSPQGGSFCDVHNGIAVATCEEDRECATGVLF